MIPLEQREILARHFEAGGCVRYAALAAGVRRSTAHGYFCRFLKHGVAKTVRQPKGPIVAPEWIGAAIGDPTITEGSGWIGQRIETQSHP